jgi:hypothetical protein
MVDLPFGLAVAPRFLNGVPDSIEIRVQRPNEALQAIDADRICVVQPVLQPRNRFAFEDAAEAHGEVAHHSEIWRRFLQNIDLCRLAGSATLAA